MPNPRLLVCSFVYPRLCSSEVYTIGSTTNKVVVPTTHSLDGLDIELKGKSKMKVSGKGVVEDWR